MTTPAKPASDAVTILTVGMLEVNCYLVPSVADGRLYLIDPGAEPERIVAAARACRLPERRILLTHAHVDHLGALPEVAKTLGASHIHLHPDDRRLYASPRNELLPLLPAVPDLPPTEPYPADGEFRVLPTPGHTRGGVSLHFPRLAAVFTGDTLFCGGIGRTDFPGGDQETLFASIRRVLYALPDDTVILPGHGPASTIGQEKRDNPWVRAV